MRLIDADRLLEILRYNKKENTDCLKEDRKTIAVDIDAVIKCVESQPTIWGDRK